MKNIFIYNNMFNEFIVYKDILLHNLKQAKQKNPNSKVCAMVKANAYGVGAETVVQILNDCVDYFGVACFFEAKQIKDLTDKRILIVGPLERIKLSERFSYTCHSLDDLKYVLKNNKNVAIHLKVNTGMNRYGIKDIETFEECLKFIRLNKLQLEGVFTHFATNDKFTDVQFNRFKKFVNLTKLYSFNPIFHCDNSETNFCFSHNMDMIRLGHCLYLGGKGNFKQVVKIKSKIVQINYVKKFETVGYENRFVAKKDLLVAVMPIGYADGFSINNIGKFLNVKNVECEILNVCMDCFMLDITNINLNIGDEIEILNENNNLNFYAKNSKTIDYEIMCKFSLLRAKKIIK